MRASLLFQFIAAALLAAGAFPGCAPAGPAVETPAGVAEPAGEDGPAGKANYYELIYSLDKDPTLVPPAKNRPEPEPEPEPEPPRPAAPSAPAAGTPAAAAAAGLSQQEQQMVNLVNQARAAAGLPAFQVNGQLTAAARAKSRDMGENNYFNHRSPTYGNFTDLISRFGVSYRWAAENIAMNSNGSVNSAHSSLMGSPGHRANILGGNYTVLGVGIYAGSNGNHYYTQLFVGH